LKLQTNRPPYTQKPVISPKHGSYSSNPMLLPTIDCNQPCARYSKYRDADISTIVFTARNLASYCLGRQHRQAIVSNPARWPKDRHQEKSCRRSEGQGRQCAAQQHKSRRRWRKQQHYAQYATAGMRALRSLRSGVANRFLQSSTPMSLQD
jgi:hypothetical protein